MKAVEQVQPRERSGVTNLASLVGVLMQSILLGQMAPTSIEYPCHQTIHSLLLEMIMAALIFSGILVVKAKMVKQPAKAKYLELTVSMSPMLIGWKINQD